MSPADRFPDPDKAGVVRSRLGKFYQGSHVIFRGHDLHAELKDWSWFELNLFGITGRRFTAAQLRLLEAIWVYTSYPDARIWNNRVAALAGSARSTFTLGVAAALAVSEATIYGGGILRRAIDFYLRTKAGMDAGERLEACIDAELEARRIIPGFGRPLVNGDERNPRILALAGELGLDQGPHLKLALAVEDYLYNGRWRVKMNYGGLTAALAADLGLSAAEFHAFWFSAFQGGMPPCYLDAVAHGEGSLFALPCSHVAYEGEPPRAWTPRRTLQDKGGVE